MKPPPATSLLLPYCPNCRRPVDSNALAWICWRTFSSHSNTASASGQAHKESLHAEFGRPADAGDGGAGGPVSRGYRREDVLCGQYNRHADAVCTSARCKAPRVREFQRPACPYDDCSEEIPLLYDVPAQTITVAGPAGAGKSHYVVALDHWWKRQLPALGFNAIPAMGRRSADNFKDHQRRVKSLQPLAATNPGEIISYSWHIRPADGRGPGLLVSLPDVSGERLMDTAALAANRHFHYSSGIVLLLDGDRLASSAHPEHETARDPEDHLTLVNAMLSDLDHRLTPEGRSELSMAVCVNKMDILGRYDPRWQDLMIRHQPDHRERYDFEAVVARSEAVEALLSENDETAALVHTLPGSFRKCMFFAVSTIGSDTKPFTFTPQGVGEPFLWMLWHMKLV